MIRLLSLAVTVPVILVAAALTASAPAAAGYGAVAYDQEARKQGFAWDEASQQEAATAAMRKCGSENCKVRFSVKPGMCAAFATPDSGPSWGGAVRKAADAAKSAALKNCQKQAKNKCVLRDTQCNKP